MGHLTRSCLALAVASALWLAGVTAADDDCVEVASINEHRVTIVANGRVLAMTTEGEVFADAALPRPGRIVEAVYRLESGLQIFVIYSNGDLYRWDGTWQFSANLCRATDVSPTTWGAAKARSFR